MRQPRRTEPDLGIFEAVAGRAVRDRVRFVRDERVANIVGNWARATSAARAANLGLTAHTDFKEIIRQYIDDCAAASDADQTLRGLSR